MKSGWSMQRNGKKAVEYVSDEFMCYDLTDVVLKVYPEFESMKLNCFSTEGSSSINLHRDSIKLFNHLFYPEDDFEDKAFAIAEEFCKTYCVEK